MKTFLWALLIIGLVLIFGTWPLSLLGELFAWLSWGLKQLAGILDWFNWNGLLSQNSILGCGK